ncbi:MAG: CoA-disulfide reductase [Intestinimonas sp.]|jgi:NADPH-dependent 2,4-dienoyl-CoA reductase/sulfur reductase-like enzyme|nr:CoA-disulfide reductase [Intestinimonas sp.]
MKVIVIGGDAAGMSAASKLKRLVKDCEIVAYEKGNYLSYAACGLPYYVAYHDMKVDSLIQRTKPEFEAAGIHPVLFHEVCRVMPEQKKVMVRNLETGEKFEDTYDKLLIATGAHPVIPSVPGTDLMGVHTLKTIDDAVKLKNGISEGVAKEVLIVGGGYIGVEAAETMAAAGLKVRVIQRRDVLLKNFDPEISSFARQELERLGVTICTSEKLKAIEGDTRVQRVVTDKGAYTADLVLLASGVVPSTEFLKDSGIALGEKGAVAVDREMRTNFPDIYAAGDCAEVYHMIKERNVYIPLATTANKCGRIVGENLSGRHVSFAGTLGSAAVKVGELELARTGLSESEARSLDFDSASVMVKASDLPHYYPGASPVWIKMIYEKGTKRILGAQGAGGTGTVLRINIFAAAVANGMKTGELGMLDLCYAPPFSTVWDAVHIAANAAK